MSLTVDLSLAQIAFITGETTQLMHRLFPANPQVRDLAGRIDRFISARADTLEARMHAGEVLAAWQAFVDTPAYHEFLGAHKRLRGANKQDHVTRRMRQLDAALKTAKPSPQRRVARRRKSVA